MWIKTAFFFFFSHSFFVLLLCIGNHPCKQLFPNYLRVNHEFGRSLEKSFALWFQNSTLWHCLAQKRHNVMEASFLPFFFFQLTGVIQCRIETVCLLDDLLFYCSHVQKEKKKWGGGGGWGTTITASKRYFVFVFCFVLFYIWYLSITLHPCPTCLFKASLEIFFCILKGYWLFEHNCKTLHYPFLGASYFQLWGCTTPSVLCLSNLKKRIPDFPRFL